MKLRELMDRAIDEIWFCVVTPDGEEHFFWNADYCGWHPDVMPELEPLLDREFDEFDLTIRPNPEQANVRNADMVPMVWVELMKTEEEMEAERLRTEANDRIEKMAETFKKDVFYIRSVVPMNYIIVYKTDIGYLVFGSDAMDLSSLTQSDCLSVGWTEVLCIPLNGIDETAKKVLRGGRSVALGEMCSEGLSKGRYEIVALIDRQDELYRIHEERNDG